RLDRFVEREREFNRMASHELRTPLAVISGAAEVALDAQDSERSVEPQLRSILHTARGMQQLIALLLALSKDPARLQSALERLDLADVVPAILEDHQFLAKPKELRFELHAPEPCPVEVPRLVAQAAIGNLVRNAVENSERGVIRVSVHSNTVVLEDPGRG